MITINWYSGELIIADSDTPPDKESPIESVLYYIHKSLVAREEQPWIKDVVKEKVNLFRPLPGQPHRTLISYQGLIDKVQAACVKRKIPFEIIDKREPFPAPQMQLMKGFWHTQFSTLIGLLRHNRSGIVKAPTRYGKSTLMINTLRAFPGIPTVLAAPGVDLMGQLVAELKAALPDRYISSVFSGARKPTGQCDDLTVCSLDSLEKLNPDSVRLVLIDEPHACAAPSRILGLSAFKRARILGFGATTTGRFDGTDSIVEGLIGPVLFEKTFQQAVKEGAICPIRVYVLRVPFDPFVCADRNRAYSRLVFKNPELNQIIQDISYRIPADWQTLIFADQVKQIDLIKLCVENGISAVASKMTTAERKAMFASMKAGDIKRCIATNIYSQGVTFPDLRCVINAAGGGGSITGTQKPGRLAQMRPGKKRGYMFDFQFVPQGWESQEDRRYGKNDKWSAVVIDGHSRVKVYRENGYDVRTICSLDEIKID